MTTYKKLVLGAICVMLSGTSNASLIDRGAGLIYDDALNVTWMQDVNYARTLGYFERMNWADANAWAAGVSYYDSVRNVSWDDWRLPVTNNSPSSSGFDVTGLSSELAYMYYVNLGYAANTSYDRSTPEPTSGNYNPFFNLAYRGFWSETPDDFAGRAWSFHFHFGLQEVDGTSDGLYLWLVRNGDVVTNGNTSVPEPGALALFAIALLGVGVSRRKKAE